MRIMDLAHAFAMLVMNYYYQKFKADLYIFKGYSSSSLWCESFLKG